MLTNIGMDYTWVCSLKGTRDTFWSRAEDLLTQEAPADSCMYYECLAQMVIWSGLKCPARTMRDLTNKQEQEIRTSYYYNIRTNKHNT